MRRSLAADVGDGDQSAARQDIKFPQQFLHAELQGDAHPFVEIGRALAGGAVADLAVAVAYQPFEELREADRDASAAGAIEGFSQRDVEGAGPRKIVTRSAENQVTGRAETLIARLGQHRDQKTHKLPPVAQHGRARLRRRSTSSAQAPRSA